MYSGDRRGSARRGMHRGIAVCDRVEELSCWTSRNVSTTFTLSLYEPWGMLLMSVPADRFDEIRRKWIARNQRTFIFQKRRAEILARQIRDRDTERTGARVDPADDDVIHPWYARPIKTPYAMFDWVILITAAVLAPLGWPAGKAVSVSVVQLIPGELRSYPIAAFMWSAAIVGVPLPLLLWLTGPGDSLVSAAAVPWLVAQIPAPCLQRASTGSWKAGWPLTGPATGGRCAHPMTSMRSTSDFCIADDLTGPGGVPHLSRRAAGRSDPIRSS